MKKTILFALTLVLCVIFGCKHEDAPEDAAKKVLLTALKDLQTHNYDAYLANTDIDCEMDSFHLAIMKQILVQHQEWQDANKGTLTDLQIVDAKMINDTVCSIYYQLEFDDSVKEACSQKMICVDGNWKIRVRN